MDQLARVKDLPAPEFGSLQAWEVRANAVARGANGENANDSKSGQGLGFGGTPMPFVGETKVEVAFSGLEEKGDIKSEVSATPMKVLPPWMIKEGMNLTKEQRGEVKQIRMEGTSAAAGSSDDKKSIESEDVKNIKDEYVKAYYEALFKRQREQEEAAKMLPETSNTDGVYNTSTERQVGMKSKREEEDEGEDIEWEEAPPAGDNSTGNFKVDLNVQADGSEDDNDEEDDIDWEEG
ncbi:hypothetical protein HAX54_037544 [Datura stramonium]|uniref:Uncharacterized protein n=1 Tax=Datura stramonium TaxID=4076 RepID=A0ABS8SH08_DATST|nr:hypothetical protein [Datura stramonium]